MKFSIGNAAAAAKRSEAWICLKAEGAAVQAPGVDVAIQGAVEAGDFTGKKGSLLSLFAPADVVAKRLYVAGLGDSAEHDRRTIRSALLRAANAVCETQAKSAEVWLRSPSEVELAVSALREAAYRYGTTKSKKPDPVQLSDVKLRVADSDVAAAREALHRAVGIADGVELAKELGNLPGNHCTPSFLAETARQLAKDKSISVEILDAKQIEKLGMGSFLSVTRGSAEPPRFIILNYQGAGPKAATHVIVGKGITFDTGGISLKPAAEMDEMKFDMGGAASVLGAFKSLQSIRPKVNVVGLIPACENMPSGTATKPGDVVTSMSGQTIEILNTDAEGRLILADALTYAERFKPATVVDVATLTGACVIALGHVNSGLFTKDDALASELLAAGEAALDPCWRMPLQDEYEEGLKTNFADVANVAGRPGGSITAACFLQRFAKNYRWAHLDVAGTAWRSGAQKGATGRPVGLLVKYLLTKAGD
jgi:leucyl aminopeptidase